MCRISCWCAPTSPLQLVNVKPAARLADPEVAEALAWPGRLFADHGWDYEIWSGADPVLPGQPAVPGRVPAAGLVPAGVTDAVLAAFRPGDTLGRAGRPALAWTVARAPPGPRCLRLLWQQRLITDLHRRLDGGSVLEAPGG